MPFHTVSILKNAYYKLGYRDVSLGDNMFAYKLSESTNSNCRCFDNPFILLEVLHIKIIIWVLAPNFCKNTM